MSKTRTRGSAAMTESARPTPGKTSKAPTSHKTAAPRAKPRSHHRKTPAAEATEDVETEVETETETEPREGEVLPPRISRKTSRVIGNAARWIQGVLPAADGGPPPVVTAARVRFAGWLWASVGLLVGCIAGALTVLLATAMPNVPIVLVGLSAGALLGATAALVVASRFPMVRKVGGMAILLLPILLLAAPFLLLAGGVALLMRFPKGGSKRKSG